MRAQERQKRRGSNPERCPPLPPLASLYECHPGLTRALSEAYGEAAAVTLARCVDSNVVDLCIEQSTRVVVRKLTWTSPDARAKRAWHNDDDATRDGAYSLSLAAVQAELGLVAVRRAETRTGADYYLVEAGVDGEAGDPAEFENSYRLEVSGVALGSEVDVRRRLRTKLMQLRRGTSNLPACAVVVGFKALLVVLARLDVVNG